MSITDKMISESINEILKTIREQENELQRTFSLKEILLILINDNDEIASMIENNVSYKNANIILTNFAVKKEILTNVLNAIYKYKEEYENEKHNCIDYENALQIVAQASLSDNFVYCMFNKNMSDNDLDRYALSDDIVAYMRNLQVDLIIQIISLYDNKLSICIDDFEMLILENKH